MTDPNPLDPSPVKGEEGKNSVLPPSTSGVVEGSKSVVVSGKELTADEQMALFEKELKENDWGHQPC